MLLKELLVDRGDCSVELYEGSAASWKCVKRGSPGLWREFEAELSRGGDVVDAPVVVAIILGIVEGVRTVGLGFCNVDAHRLGGCVFVDDEHFCQLETALTQIGAREVVIPKDLLPQSDGQIASAAGGISLADRTRLIDVLNRCGVLYTERPRVEFSAKSLVQDLKRLIKNGPESVEAYRCLIDDQLASAALSAIITFADLLADESNHGRVSLEVYSTGRYMKLDAAALQALNILRGRGESNDSFSLYGLLNRGKTAMGKRLLKAWIKQPLTDPKDISLRHDIVESFVTDTSLRSDLLSLHLRGLPDVDRLSRKLDRRSATLQDLCQLYRASSRLPLIESAIRSHLGPHTSTLCRRYADVLAQVHDAEHLTKFEELLEAAIDLDRIPDEYLIASTYDEGLAEIENEKLAVENEIQKLANEAADDLGLVLDKTVKLEWHKSANRRLRCLRITAKEEKVVRKKLQAKYLELETRKDGIKFTNRQLRNAAERLQNLTLDYDKRQETLVSQVVQVASTFAEVWERVSSLLAELDVLCAFADLAVSAPKPYVRPEILEANAGVIKLVASRHPCVEAQDGVSFIPNDACLQHGESWFQVITGPNMGGKSTFVRQIGVCVLMAQIGSFVPCDSAQIAVRDAIFARVGAGDCQMRGISTFMAEMLETAAILKGATASSLVIIDELGRGTSTWDGMGLAWAISEHLMNEIGAATLFATHFHELTLLEGATGVKNLHVKSALDPSGGGLTMLYQVCEGFSDQSLGIHVAEFAKFPHEIVEAAKQKAKEFEDYHPSTDDHIASRKRKRSHLIKETLTEFASEPFDSLEGEKLQASLSAWVERFQGLEVGLEALVS